MKSHPSRGTAAKRASYSDRRTVGRSKTRSNTQSNSRKKTSGKTRKTVAAVTLRGGQAWSRVLKRGQILRITDSSGGACVAGLLYNAREPIERYNMADTLKAQYTAFLTSGRVLYSDMGRILVSIIDDSCGWHDTISGCSNAASQDLKFGSGSYQELRNDFFRNTHDNFVVELSKRGMGKRDIVANVNFFVRLSVDADGNLVWASGHSRPGAHVELRAEMDTLVVLSNTPHPLDPDPAYGPPAVELSIREATRSERAGELDPCRLSRPENGRGFALTEAYVAELEPVPGKGTLA